MYCYSSAMYCLNLLDRFLISCFHFRSKFFTDSVGLFVGTSLVGLAMMAGKSLKDKGSNINLSSWRRAGFFSGWGLRMIIALVESKIRFEITKQLGFLKRTGRDQGQEIW